MSVLIGHASIDERGRAYGGSAGDQTGREVYIRSWYPHSRGWNVCLRFRDAAKAEKAAAFVEQCCRGNMVGYDQWQRNTLRDVARAAGWSGKNIKTPCETDCAAFMTVAAEAAGIDMDSCYLAFANGQLNAPVTSTMMAKFAATGAFDVLTDSKYLTTDRYLRRGDILIREDAHTVMVLSNGSAAGGAEENHPLLKKGASGSDVKRLQEKLKALGYELGTWGADGFFGNDTLSAVRAFQQANGLTVDGIVGTATWSVLESKAAVGPAEGGATDVSGYPVLRKGSSGECVRRLQKGLNAFLVESKAALLEEDGLFGGATRTAVRFFQQENGLNADGIVGPKTWAKLAEKRLV